MQVSRDWREVAAELDFAFQPVVNVHTGVCYGYEALLRDVERVGFASIPALFDAAHNDGALFRLDLALREMAIEKFRRLPGHPKFKLFLNLDTRTLEVLGYNPGNTLGLMTEYGLDPRNVVFELSERHNFVSQTEATRTLNAFRRQGISIAIDDFGTGFSGLMLLYSCEAEFVKIDRFFIQAIETDARKRMFLTHIIGMAHLLGIRVIAEGVETPAEFMTARELGCDLIQGFLIQVPTTELSELRPQYDTVAEINRRDRRASPSDHMLLTRNMHLIEPLSIDTDMTSVLEIFRRNHGAAFMPVVDANGEALGIVRDRELKHYAFSAYGRDLLSNRVRGHSLAKFVVKNPIADINTKTERILEAFSAAGECEGIILVDNMKYAGFLTAGSLVKVIYEKNLALARDQNPLTRLPGNNSIYEYLSTILDDGENGYVLAYFDFDNFKPFNDKIGFRQGDRAILLFGELLTRLLPAASCFIAHIGGDDFFAGFRGVDLAHAVELVALAQDHFARDVSMFYSPEDRERGHIVTTDREGQTRRFPLLTVSAAILDLPALRERGSPDTIAELIAAMKKNAKTAPDRRCIASRAGRLLPACETGTRAAPIRLAAAV